MRRSFEKILLEWKSHPLRMPLIVRGARQVGKTYAIQAFGAKHFKTVLSINFEESPLYQSCFDTLDPQSIISQIELISRQKIILGETLLFLDEIQQCPKALQSLSIFQRKNAQFIPKQVEESVFDLADGSIFESEKTPPTSSSEAVFSDSSLLPSALSKFRFFNLFGYTRDCSWVSSGVFYS